MPLVDVEGETHAVMTHQLTNIRASLAIEPFGSLQDVRGEIVAAMDMLITGV